MKRTRAGFTMLEMVVSTGLIGLVVGASLAVSLAGRSAVENGMLQTTADAKVRLTLERMVAELSPAGASTLISDPSGPNGDDSISYFPLIGVNGSAPIWGDAIDISRRPTQEDPDDGVDNDGDGIVDEGEIVLTHDVGGPNQQVYVLCTGVPELFRGETADGADNNGNGLIDEPGFCLRRIGSLLEVRISVQLAGRGGTTVTSSATTSLTLRN